MSLKVNSDVVVLGGGPGGYVAAIRASQLGAKVTLVEKDKLGGTCTNKGCIPTKALINIGELIYNSRQLENYGVHVNLSELSFAKIINESNSIAKEVREGIENLMIKNHVDVLRGTGRLRNNHIVEVIDAEGVKSVIEASSIIVATGSSPLIPPIPGVGDKRIITSDNIWKLQNIPQKIVIIGAGAVGLELGTIFKNFGSEVVIVEMMPQILPKEDGHIAKYLQTLLEEEKIRIILGSKVNKITSAKEGLSLHLENGESIDGDMVLLAVGRVSNSEGIGLETIVEMNRGRILVDDHMRTKTRNIFAIGDVVGKWMLAHVAMDEGLVAGENAAGGDIIVDYNSVPRCVYTDPEVAFVGLCEREALEQKLENVKTAIFPLRFNGRARTMKRTKGAIKLVYDAKNKKLLGAQIVSPQASELMGELCLAMHLGATIEDLANTMHAHPTLSESIREAALKGIGKELHM